MEMGTLVPVSWFEALPGDTIQMRTSAFVRVSPTLAPTMTPCRIEFKTFSVPNRILWDHSKDDCWESFITGGDDGLDASLPPFYFIPSGSTFQTGSLLDYLGVPAGEAFGGDIAVSALPIRAYYKIWNEYFRDEDLQNEDSSGLANNGGNQGTITHGFELKRVNWGKDYFTVARPFEQKGPAVTVPVNLTTDGSTPIVSATTTLSGSNVSLSGNSNWTQATSQLVGRGNTLGFSTSDDPQGAIDQGIINVHYTAPVANTTVTWNGSPDTTGAITVNDIREAFALQRFEEARALFGSRYVEYLRYLGVRSSDSRLQRPEYLGGGSQVIQWSEVVQTGQGSDPVGTLRGHGVSAGRTRRWRRFFEEHCIVMTLAWIRPLAMYTQSLPRAWSRTLKEDYWQKELEHIGQQEVLNKEVYALGATPDGVFGYMDRYDDYRSVQSTVCGDFRSTMDHWHLGRVFANQPVLNSDFISCNPSKRIFTEQTAHPFYCMFLHSVQARRLIARRGRPGGL